MSWIAGKKIWIAFGFAALMAGCGGNGGGTFQNTNPDIYFVSGSSDTSSLDVRIDNSLVVSNLKFGTVSPQVYTTADTHDLILLQSGTSNQLDAITTNFNANTDTLSFAVGLQNPDPNDIFGDEKVLQIVAQQVNLQIPNGSKARLIVVQGFNRASGYETPNVDLRPPGDNVAGSATLANIAFATAQSIDVDTTQNTFVIRRNGTEQVYIGPQTFNLQPGKIYVLLVSGVEGGTTGNLKPQMKLIPLK